MATKVRTSVHVARQLSRDYAQYHIAHFGPTDPWPNGGWSLYKITGDEIASRVVYEGEWPDRKVVRRDSWCGYIGLFETLSELMAAIEKDHTA